MDNEKVTKTGGSGFPRPLRNRKVPNDIKIYISDYVHTVIVIRKYGVR